MVTGDRDWNNVQLVDNFFKTFIVEKYPVEEYTLVHGDCRGADKITALIAKKYGYILQAHQALWGKYGNRAGPLRNAEMVALRPEVILILHDNLQNSKGTKSCLTILHNNLKKFPTPPLLYWNGKLTNMEELRPHIIDE